MAARFTLASRTSGKALLLTPSGIVRHATMADKIAVLELIKAFYYAKGLDRADGPTRFVVKPEIAYAERWFLHHLNDQDCCCIVYEVEERPRGVLMASAFDHPFGQVRAADESMWWVDPAYRGFGSLKMIDAYEDWARSKGCIGAAMTEFCDHPVGAIYKRKGYGPLETKYFKPL